MGDGWIKPTTALKCILRFRFDSDEGIKSDKSCFAEFSFQSFEYFSARAFSITFVNNDPGNSWKLIFFHKIVKHLNSNPCRLVVEWKHPRMNGIKSNWIWKTHQQDGWKISHGTWTGHCFLIRVYLIRCSAVCSSSIRRLGMGEYNFDGNVCARCLEADEMFQF